MDVLQARACGHESLSKNRRLEGGLQILTHRACYRLHEGQRDKSAEDLMCAY